MSTWIFGYGSLIHNPGFKYSAKVQGYIKGYKRAFWQGSTDHRGTPSAPGRTVTLYDCQDAITWGVAYKLAGDAAQQAETVKYLEWREKQYDVRRHVAVFEPRSPTQPVVPEALVYLGSDDKSHNVNYLGPAPLEEIAQQIASAIGPSGPNYEYLYKLAAAMREMGVNDEELFDLEARVREIRGELVSTPDLVPAIADTQ